MISFLRLWPKRTKPTLTKPQPVPPRAPAILTGMTRQKWFASPEHANSLRELFRVNPVLRDWLSVAWSEMPVLRRIPTDCQPTATTFAAGKSSGHLECLELLESCMVSPTRQTEVPVTYDQTVEEAFAPKE